MINFSRAVQLHQLARQGATVVTMVGLAQLGVDFAEVGNFESLRYLAYALSAFWLGGLGNAYLRQRQTTQHAERWFVFYLLIVLLGAILVFALFATGTRTLGRWLVDAPALEHGLAFGTFVMGQLAGSAVEQEAIGDRAKWRLLAYSLSGNALQVGLFLGPLYAGLPMLLAMWGLAASAVYRVAWVALRYLRKRDARLPEPAERRQFWSTASSLSVYGLMTIAVVAVDHALVGYTSADAKQAIALWRYGAQELPLLVGVVSALNATALAEGQSGERTMLWQIKSRSDKLTLVVLPLAIALMATSQWWWTRVFSAEFAPAQALFNTMLLLVPSRMLLTTPILISQDRHRRMTSVGIVENLANVAVSLALVPWLGMLGIALGTVVAFCGERAAYVSLLARGGTPLGSYLGVRRWALLSLGLLIAYALCTDFDAILALR